MPGLGHPLRYHRAKQGQTLLLAHIVRVVQIMAVQCFQLNETDALLHVPL